MRVLRSSSGVLGGGAGLGTCGFTERTARELCHEAGFAGFRRIPLDNPFNNLYEATA